MIPASTSLSAMQTATIAGAPSSPWLLAAAAVASGLLSRAALG